MGAQFTHEFSGGFIVGEEHLRRCVQIISERLSSRENLPVIAVKVVRSDSFVYSTETVDMVAKEENSGDLSIVEVEVVAKASDINLALIFAKKGATLRVEGSNRDEVFLLADEIRQYVRAATMSRWVMSRSSEHVFRLLWVIAIGVGGIIYISGAAGGLDAGKAQAALDSSDLAMKIDFLIERSRRTSNIDKFPLYFAIGAAVMAFGHSVILRALRWIYPVNQFSIGKNISNLANRAALREKLVWIVGASILLGLLVEFGADYLKR